MKSMDEALVGNSWLARIFRSFSLVAIATALIMSWLGLVWKLYEDAAPLLEAIAGLFIVIGLSFLNWAHPGERRLRLSPVLLRLLIFCLVSLIVLLGLASMNSGIKEFSQVHVIIFTVLILASSILMGAAFLELIHPAPAPASAGKSHEDDGSAGGHKVSLRQEEAEGRGGEDGEEEADGDDDQEAEQAVDDEAALSGEDLEELVRRAVSPLEEKMEGLADSLQRIETSIKSNNELKAQIQQLTTKKKDLAEKNAALEVAARSHETELTEKDDRIRELETELSKQKNQISAEKGEIDRLKEELRKAEESAIAIEKRCGDLDRESKARAKTISDLEEKIKGLEAEVSRLKDVEVWAWPPRVSAKVREVLEPSLRDTATRDSALSLLAGLHLIGLVPPDRVLTTLEALGKDYYRWAKAVKANSDLEKEVFGFLQQHIDAQGFQVMPVRRNDSIVPKYHNARGRGFQVQEVRSFCIIDAEGNPIQKADVDSR
jgi:hypothetical protein